jgi:conjugal transfer/entry exclusion protein
MRRRIFMLGGALLPLAVLGGPRRAHAIVVEDVASIAQIGTQIATTGAQVQATLRQLEALRNAARRLDPRTYQTVGALLDGDALTLQAITRDVTNIGYTLDRVNRTYSKIFPDEAAVRNMRPGEHAETSRQVHQEVYASALVAHRAQTNLSKLEANNAEAKAILQRSGADDSQVVQLQSATKMLALVHDNLVSITQTVATAGRVSSDMAAAGVTDNRIARERQRRSLENFDRPPNNFTGIDPSFLWD